MSLSDQVTAIVAALLANPANGSMNIDAMIKYALNMAHAINSRTES